MSPRRSCAQGEATVTSRSGYLTHEEQQLMVVSFDARHLALSVRHSQAEHGTAVRHRHVLLIAHLPRPKAARLPLSLTLTPTQHANDALIVCRHLRIGQGEVKSPRASQIAQSWAQDEMSTGVDSEHELTASGVCEVVLVSLPRAVVGGELDVSRRGHAARRHLAPLTEPFAAWQGQSRVYQRHWRQHGRIVVICIRQQTTHGAVGSLQFHTHIMLPPLLTAVAINKYFHTNLQISLPTHALI